MSDSADASKTLREIVVEELEAFEKLDGLPPYSIKAHATGVRLERLSGDTLELNQGDLGPHLSGRRELIAEELRGFFQ